MKISHLANNITTSPILTFAAFVNKKIANGENIYNLTVGDFDSNIYPIPYKLKQNIIQAYQDNQTNYPGAFGMLSLRNGIVNLLNKYCHIDINIDNILIASGSRPLIYATFKAVVDKGDKVIFPVPSWNNDYYTTLTDGNAIMIETTAENNFMPTKESLSKHIKDATLIALCSPQNPTGTIFSRQNLIDICDLVIAENKRRTGDQKPLYVMFDQVYWLMTFDNDKFYHAQSLKQEMSQYAVFIDGMSKSFAATGVRVGWASGPSEIIAKMRSFIAHIGAWAPKAEQVAIGEYFKNLDDVDEFTKSFNTNLKIILNQLFDGFIQMKELGLPVDSIKPEASIYLSIKLDLIGKKTQDGAILKDADMVQNFILTNAKVAILPFAWFGATNCNNWYRISIGTCPLDAVTNILTNMKNAISSLN